MSAKEDCNHSTCSFIGVCVCDGLFSRRKPFIWSQQTCTYSTQFSSATDAFEFHYTLWFSYFHCALYSEVERSVVRARRLDQWYVLRAILGKLPFYLSSLLNSNCGNRSLLSLDALWFVVPKVRTELGKETIPQSKVKLKNMWLVVIISLFHVSAVNLLKLCCNCSWPGLPFKRDVWNPTELKTCKVVITFVTRYRLPGLV